MKCIDLMTFNVTSSYTTYILIFRWLVDEEEHIINRLSNGCAISSHYRICRFKVGGVYASMYVKPSYPHKGKPRE